MNHIRILYVEDDMSAAGYLSQFLEAYGFEVVHSDSVAMAHSYINREKFDIVLLDLQLPDFSGFELLKATNALTLPVIVISAYSDTPTKVKAFRYGAWDYMVKPIDLTELEARIWSHLNHSGKIAEPASDCDISFENNRLTVMGKHIDLTPTESDIFRMLYKNKNRTVSREQLASLLSDNASERTLDYHIRNIRKKIGDENKNPRYLKTEYGAGYKLTL